jgi:hypothetical protein
LLNLQHSFTKLFLAFLFVVTMLIQTKDFLQSHQYSI